MVQSSGPESKEIEVDARRRPTFSRSPIAFRKLMDQNCCRNARTEVNQPPSSCFRSFYYKILFLSSENEVKNRWYSAVHKMTSGRKRKEQDCNRSNSGSSNAYADSDDLHHTNYSPIEADIIAFSNGNITFSHLLAMSTSLTFMPLNIRCPSVSYGPRFC